MILHITTAERWTEALSLGHYHHPSLADEGFIHCSDPEQVLSTANEYYRGQRNLVLLCISPKLLKASLVYEDKYDKGETFPHIYGPLNLDAVVQQFDFPANDDGSFSLPEDFQIMRTIRPITKSEIDDFLTISANAYPGFPMRGDEARERARDRLLKTWEDSEISYVALFEDGEMRGIMRLYDFKMNFLSSRTLVGGIGGLAVDLLHKKEKVAADMIRYFLDHYKKQGACLTALYPFRPDFYRRMGYGYGTKRDLYRVKPDSLPRGVGDGELAFLSVVDKEGLRACYDRFLSRKHGLMERFEFSWDHLLANPDLQFVGIKRQGQIRGYLMIQFEKGRHDHFLNNDLLIREVVYDSAGDLLELLRFLHLQVDQIDRVAIYTQDEFFFYLLHDPRNDSGNLIPQVYHETNTQGVGIMYRVIDMPRLFQVLEDHNFGKLTCRLKIVLADSFFPENAGSYTIHFQDGRPTVVEDATHDVAIEIDVSEFSSLIMGAINFRSLVELGLVSLSNSSYADMLDHLFAAPKPICYTEF